MCKRMKCILDQARKENTQPDCPSDWMLTDLTTQV